MVFCGISIELKKTGLAAILLLPCLLLQPLLLQAESSTDVKSEESTDKAVASHQAAEGSRAAVQRPVTGAGNNASFGFPKWPQRQQAGREMIPPPPPGPYMSSALSDYSVKAPSFGRSINKPVHRYDPSIVPMDMFSPDIPWPDNLRQAKHKHKHQSPNRWMPENGYHYVSTQKMAPRPNNQQPPVQVRQQNQKRQYRGANNLPNMNMDGSRWMPSMGFAPNGPYSNAPVYNGSAYRNQQGPRSNQSGPYRSAPDQSGSN